MGIEDATRERESMLTLANRAEIAPPCENIVSGMTGIPLGGQFVARKKKKIGFANLASTVYRSWPMPSRSAL